MKRGPRIHALAAIVLVVGLMIVMGPARAQASGLSNNGDLGAYSREATDAAKARLKETIAAVFAGGRHGYIKG
jgi:hypothetical protein